MSLNCFRNDLSSLEKLLQNLWSNCLPEKDNSNHKTLHSYQKIENKCEEIAYNLSLAHWLARYMGKTIEKTKHTRILQLLNLPLSPNESSFPTPKPLILEANRIFPILEKTSLIYTLKPMLQELNLDELLLELDRNQPKISHRLCCSHENNYNMLLIYSLANEFMNLVLYRVSQRTVPESVFLACQDVLQGYLARITRFDYQLILFELLLRLTRLKLKHLRIFSKSKEKISSISLRKSKDTYLLNKRLGLCILELIERNLKIPEKLADFSIRRLEALLKQIREYRLKTEIVYSSERLITSSWKAIQGFKRIALKGQEDFDSSTFSLKYDHIFRNKKVYASYYMNYLEFSPEYLLKLSLANHLFSQAELLIEVFQMKRDFSYHKDLVQAFSFINEKAGEIVSKELGFSRVLLDYKGEKSTIEEILLKIRGKYSFEENNYLIEDEIFKFLADFSFTSEIPLNFVPFLLKDTQKWLESSNYKEILLFGDYFNRMILLVEHNLTNQQVPKGYSISSLISDTKNIENLAVEPALLLEHLSQKTTEKQILLHLAEKLLKNQCELPGSLTHKELYKLIRDTIEILSKKTEEGFSAPNFVKLFLKHLLELGGIMKEALSKNLELEYSNLVLSEFNYGLLLLIDPRDIISIMIFLLKCENETIKIAQLMKVNILEVILNENSAKQLKKWPLLPLFNVKKQEDFRVKNRIIRFIFELESQFNEYKFLYEEDKYVQLPIFSIVALLSQELTPITKSKEVYNFNSIKGFL